MSECLSYLFRYQNNHGNKWLCLMTALQQVNNAEVSLLSYKQVTCFGVINDTHEIVYTL